MIRKGFIHNQGKECKDFRRNLCWAGITVSILAGGRILTDLYMLPISR